VTLGELRAALQEYDDDRVVGVTVLAGDVDPGRISHALYVTKVQPINQQEDDCACEPGRATLCLLAPEVPDEESP